MEIQIVLPNTLYKCSRDGYMAVYSSLAINQGGDIICEIHEFQWYRCRFQLSIEIVLENSVFGCKTLIVGVFMAHDRPYYFVLVMPYYVKVIDHRWIQEQGFMIPCYPLDHWKKLPWSSNHNTMIFFQDNACQNIVCKISTIALTRFTELCQHPSSTASVGASRHLCFPQS